jgi:hypothetical protein
MYVYIPLAIGTSGVPRETDKESSVVAIVSRPPVLGVSKEFLEIFLDFVPVHLGQCFDVLLLNFCGGKTGILRGLLAKEGTSLHTENFGKDFHGAAVVCFVVVSMDSVLLKS